MSFSGIGKSIKSQVPALVSPDATVAARGPCDSMSLQLVIPGRVALQQSPLPLHQLAPTLQQWRGALQPAMRRYLNTTLSRGLTLGVHPTPGASKPLKRLAT